MDSVLSNFLEEVMSVDIAKLIHKGGVFADVCGKTPEEIYRFVCDNIELPSSISANTIYNALCAREKVMSTAVGNGIALPHSRMPILTDESEQRICVVYLKEPLDMKAPDECSVSVMFVLLTANPKVHLQVLSTLVSLFQKKDFKKLLENKAGEEELLAYIRGL